MPRHVICNVYERMVECPSRIPAIVEQAETELRLAVEARAANPTKSAESVVRRKRENLKEVCVYRDLLARRLEIRECAAASLTEPRFVAGRYSTDLRYKQKRSFFLRAVEDMSNADLVLDLALTELRQLEAIHKGPDRARKLMAMRSKVKRLKRKSNLAKRYLELEECELLLMVG